MDIDTPEGIDDALALLSLDDSAMDVDDDTSTASSSKRVHFDLALGACSSFPFISPPTVDIRIKSPSELTPSNPPSVLKLALQVPHLHDAAFAACVQAELHREAGRLGDDACARNLVRTMTALWKLETESAEKGEREMR